MPDTFNRFHSLLGYWLLPIVVLLLLGGCGEELRLTPVAAGQTVLAFGDSVTHGTGAGPGEDWPSLLAPATGWNVLNAGVPGDTAMAGKSRLPSLLARHRPALVLIEMGGNDFLRRRPQSVVKEDIRSLVRMSRQAGAQVVLVAVPEPSLLGVIAGQPGDAPIYRELGKEERVPVIEEVFADALSDPELRADTIHPNAAGYRRMAVGIHDRLKALGLIAGNP